MGMYQHVFTVEEREALARAGPGMDEEVAVLRVTLRRLLDLEPEKEEDRPAFYDLVGRQVGRLHQVLRGQPRSADDLTARLGTLMERVEEHKRRRRAGRKQRKEEGR